MSRFSTPTKRIFDSADLEYFQRSLAYKRLHQTITFLLGKVKGIDMPRGCLDATIVTRKQDISRIPKGDSVCFDKLSYPAKAIVDILEKFNLLIDDTPPLKGPRRFGNMACRDWHAKVESNAGSLISSIVSNPDACDELEYYLVNSFGSSLRLDYGLGHELSFVAFLGGLLECNVIGNDIKGSEILAVFAKYYDLVRRLIIDYNLEPAGSHGVWGLDDHFHFIYILGAAQFNQDDETTSSRYIPSVQRILSPETLETFQVTNLYVNAIAFIFKIKYGPFNEHSPILYDIQRSVSLWSKVLSGLLKMYEVEVFGKFPVVQHFWFGEGFFPWKDAQTLRDLPTRQPEEAPTDTADEDPGIPGLIAGLQGQKTTRSNISMTAAPWALANSSAPNTTVPRRGMGNASMSRFTSKRS